MREKERRNEQSMSGEREKEGGEEGEREDGGRDTRTGAAVSAKTRVMPLLTGGTNYWRQQGRGGFTVTPEKAG